MTTATDVQPAPATPNDEARTTLLSLLSPGDTVYCILRHVSASGMTRHVSFLTLKDGQPRYLDYSIGKLLGYTRVKQGDGLIVRGAGMDMGFSVVYGLGHTLWPDGFGVEGKLSFGQVVRAETKDEAAFLVERGGKFYGRNGGTSGWDTDGGYALTVRWL